MIAFILWQMVSQMQKKRYLDTDKGADEELCM